MPTQTQMTRRSTKLDVHFSTGKDDWQTPQELFERYHKEYSFILDAAANETNHLLPRWYGPGGEHEDALSVEWPLCEGNIWLNPPYSRGLQKQFIAKAVKEVTRCNVYTVVALLPARTDTSLFHDLLYCKPRVEIEFLRGRLQFLGAKYKAPFPSMVVVLR